MKRKMTIVHHLLFHRHFELITSTYVGHVSFSSGSFFGFGGKGGGTGGNMSRSLERFVRYGTRGYYYVR